MPLNVLSECPTFVAPTQDGVELDLREYVQKKWIVLFSYPADFTPVCSTEMADFARYHEEFANRNCRLIGISSDSSESHKRWLQDVQKLGDREVTFPVVSDINGEALAALGLLETPQDKSINEEPNKKHRTLPKPVRGLYIVNPEMVIQFVQIMPPSVGRSIVEVLRVLDAVQLASLRNIATPAGWQKGQDVLLPASTGSSETAERRNDDDLVNVVFPYLKFVRLQPNQSLQSIA